jgi:excinuclease ABC subunit C
MNQQEFNTISKTLPHSPGIYKYYNALNALVYIGKAKNIRKRVSSYFNKTGLSYKTAELVKQIHRIEFTIVQSEHDALLLENSLIKQFKPKYNIELKDDKTYPYIVIKNERFPRVFLTRRKINDGSEYLGPFTSASKVRDLLLFIKQHIPLRTCSFNLSETQIEKGKYKVCLEYHLGNCKGPCTGLQREEDYQMGIDQIKHTLKGNLNPIFQEYKRILKEHIAQLQFEQAARIQKKIDDLQHYQSKSSVTNYKLANHDVFASLTHEEAVVVSYLALRNGSIINSGVKTFIKKLDESEEDILGQAIVHFQHLYSSDEKFLIVPFSIPFGFESYTVSVPKSGEKKKLLDIAMANAQFHLNEWKSKRSLHLKQETHSMEEVLMRIQQALYLSEKPNHIECFDNSNFQGSYPVSALVCFKDGIPSKKDYRHFNIKTVQGINDFASMKEAVGRRYKRLLAENQPLPQLVIIDGGKGQLSAAQEAIREIGLSGKLTLIGLAKNVEEIFFTGDKESLKLDYQSEVLKFLRRIRDEVHRYGVTFHRQKRSAGTFKNELIEIKGIGSKTAEDLLRHFRSVAQVKNASFNELEKKVGAKKAQLIMNHFHA